MRERVWRPRCVGVKGLEADSAHKAHGDRVLYLHQDKPDMTSSDRRGSCSKGDVLLVSNPETKFAIIISAVSNLSSVTLR